MIQFKYKLSMEENYPMHRDSVPGTEAQRTITLKICIIGSFGTGKTSLRRKFMGARFKRNYIATVGADFSMKKYSIDNKTYQLLIWDLAGNVKFDSVRSLYFQGAFGALVVFDLTRRDSFDELDKWIKDIEISTQTQSVPFIILGNKSDLLINGEYKTVSREEIDTLINKLNEKYKNKFNVKYIETSALTGKNVDNAFKELIKEIDQWIPKRRDKH